MNRRRVAVALFVLACLLAAPSVLAANGDGPTVADARHETNAVQSLSSTAGATVPVAASGFLLGVGLGGCVGAVGAFAFWRRRV